MAKKALAPVLYRHRPIGLSAGKLYLYLDALYRTKDVPGDIIEIGCNVCGTASLGRQLLRKMDVDKRYICVDTFAGFVEEQHDDDVQRGNPGGKGAAFGASDIDLARRVLEIHGSDDVELVQGDICAMSSTDLPDRLSLALIDVDLYQPIYAGLELALPKMSSGGIMLVDDCGERPKTWQGGQAFREFVAAHDLEHRVEFGMGVITLS